ncbi:hypothetical protein [Xanthobacter wiegelii]|uniref:hypothetical protein n=1 Tax=Xanthobacter wiegelii TaxID=3119913 RepID=UPI00372CDF07
MTQTRPDYTSIVSSNLSLFSNFVFSIILSSIILACYAKFSYADSSFRYKEKKDEFTGSMEKKGEQIFSNDDGVEAEVIFQCKKQASIIVPDQMCALKQLDIAINSKNPSSADVYIENNCKSFKSTVNANVAIFHNGDPIQFQFMRVDYRSGIVNYKVRYDSSSSIIDNTTNLRSDGSKVYTNAVVLDIPTFSKSFNLSRIAYRLPVSGRDAPIDIYIDYSNGDFMKFISACNASVGIQ